MKEIGALVKEKTGRRMQAKSSPLREGVVVIDEKTTMDDLKRLANAFKLEFGIDTLQIAIHRDEGHENAQTGQWMPNLHAHIIFDWYNHETGRSHKTSKADAHRMQDLCADVLGMERGTASEQKHLDAQRYKAHQVAAQGMKLEQRNTQLEASIERNAHRTGILPSIQALWGGGEKSKAKEAIREAEAAKAKAKADVRQAEAAKVKAQKHEAAIIQQAKTVIAGIQKQAKDEVAAKAAEYEQLKKETEAARQEVLDKRATIVQEGKTQAVLEVLTVAKLHFPDSKNEDVTPERIGKAWAATFNREQSAKAEAQRLQVERSSLLSKEEASEIRRQNHSMELKNKQLQSELDRIKRSHPYQNACRHIATVTAIIQSTQNKLSSLITGLQIWQQRQVQEELFDSPQPKQEEVEEEEEEEQYTYRRRGRGR